MGLQTQQSSCTKSSICAHQFDFDRLFQRLRAAAGQQVGVDTQAPQHRHTMLCGLGFLLSNHPQHWNQANMHAAEVATTHSELELPAVQLHSSQTLDDYPK